MTHSTEEMMEHRAHPAEKKSQRNPKRHFRSSSYAFAEGNRDFAYAQCAIGTHNGLENDLETARFGCQFQQTGTANGKEAAHRIMKTGERIGERRTCSRHDPAPHRPALCRSAFDITATDYQVRSAGK